MNAYPHREPKLVHLTGKSQPVKLDKQHALRLRNKTNAEETFFPPTRRPETSAAPPVGQVTVTAAGGHEKNTTE